MSSITSVAVFPVRPQGAPSRTRLRLTARGRRVLAAVVALPIVIAIGFLALAGGGALASSETGEAAAFETITVVPGDSLWTIADEVAPAEDPRDVIESIVRLNLLDSATIVVGQELAIPAEYTSLAE